MTVRGRRPWWDVLVLVCSLRRGGGGRGCRVRVSEVEGEEMWYGFRVVSPRWHLCCCVVKCAEGTFPRSHAQAQLREFYRVQITNDEEHHARVRAHTNRCNRRRRREGNLDRRTSIPAASGIPISSVDSIGCEAREEADGKES